MWLNFILFLLINLNICSFYLIFVKNPMFCIMWLVYFYILISFLILLFGFEYYSMLVVMLYVGAIAVIFLFICMMLHIFEVEYDYAFSFFSLTSPYFNFFFNYKIIFFYFLINNFIWFSIDEDYDLVLSLDHYDFLLFTWNLIFIRLENIEYISHFFYIYYFFPFLIASIILLLLVISCILLIVSHSNDQ
jgi:NADH:ubiquinone oxidoreductase subunit 6 (subunit J)